jgi:hypothetical protein
VPPQVGYVGDQGRKQSADSVLQEVQQDGKKVGMSEVINAFHPDYVKTYMPEIMKDFRTHAANREVREEKKLKVNRKPLKTVTRSLTVKISKEQARLDLQKRKELMLNNRDFKYFSGAGMPKGVK